MHRAKSRRESPKLSRSLPMLPRTRLLYMARWHVDIIRKRAERLGTIEAANEKEAIEKAAKEFDIPPERQNRIAVEKVSKSKE
jgi:hypothetical protein